MRYIRTTVFILSFFIILTGSCIAEELPLTLDEAISIALRDNRDILLKEEAIKQAKAQIDEANAGRLPTLDFQAARSDTAGYYSKDLSQTTTQATLKQYLYKGGKTQNTIKYYRENLKAQDAALEQSKIETILNVKTAFYTLLLAIDYVDLNSHILKNTQGHAKALKKRFQSGEASKQDLLLIDSSLAGVNQAYKASLSQVESLRLLLNNLLYLDKSVEILPQGQLDYQQKEVAVSEGFLEAASKRPEIKKYQAQIEMDKKSIEIEKAGARPSIYASWDYYSRSHAVASTNKGWNDYNVLGLTFSWPIFDGWQAKAKVDAAIAQLKQAQFLKEQAIRDIALELKDAYLDLRDAIVKIKSSDKEQFLYQDTLRAAEEKYKAGITSQLDLDDAALGYKVSVYKYKQAIFDYVSAKARFEKAAGGQAKSADQAF